MLVQRIIKKDINRCYNECPYIGKDGNVMVCDFKGAEDQGYIISHPEADIGFPKKCPLIKQKIEWEKEM